MARRNRILILISSLVIVFIVFYVSNFYSRDSSEERIEDDEERSAQTQTKFPEHWGEPPKIQTRDYRVLPGGYGYGSSTLAKWIQKHLDEDRENGLLPPNEQSSSAQKDLEEQPEYLP
mmetsp:Transcript_22142/g.30424  ORF Transcript_22142/g.30424 Transcript_22142/m.30424 type:complete len:118 (-) Transcript_22142:924-1277(-)|eukprot:CAMPEP_0201481086 /NCGR_PEP_ID=MMETSP0151_2-20130828/5412_1 /ASSEMBLY_ACC=CAM_ASM_000257 /TAXON_ID=200890 /ORGANISM="Paramoeba atlantica, Strain 621/1 / CCAP 1560/9" /LENGTH=117 /DNA_ID=CAMNT_0047863123 /DNA_START=77 /DNA_END=430 /DNA_ORIENTATION=-